MSVLSLKSVGLGVCPSWGLGKPLQSCGPTTQGVVDPQPDGSPREGLSSSTEPAESLGGVSPPGGVVSGPTGPESTWVWYRDQRIPNPLECGPEILGSLSHLGVGQGPQVLIPPRTGERGG